MVATIGAPVDQDDRKALEALIVDNEDLEKLEALIAEFNIFEAIGAVRSELRHSDVLAFLLDPNESHGLGDSFLRRFLQKVLATAQKAPASPVHVDVWDLDEVEVRREWSNVDVLIVDSRNRLVVIVENKVDSGEHSDQLRRYWGVVEREFPEWRILGLYLTPDHDEPSDERYSAIDYALIAEVVRRFVEARSSTIGPDVRTFLRHYEQMLRRHIVSDSDIAELCRKLYRKHRHAFDLIFQHRPDAGQGVARDLIEKLVREQSDIVLDDCTRAYVRFAPKQWDLPKLKGGGWTKSGRMLLFEFVIGSERIVLKLHIGPGPTEVRERLFKFAQTKPALFKAVSKSISAKWNQIYTRTFLEPKDTALATPETIEQVVREHWAAFTKDDLRELVAAFESETWLREP
jgi:hypothetical protein